jgi:uncharacterized protein YjeT (DUF2065 family)
MGDFLTALGLVLVIEGALWSLFPGPMKRAAAQAQTIDATTLRIGGLVFATLGVAAVWLVRG